MAWYKSAGYKFWVVLSIEYFLILAGMMWHNSYMVIGGMIFGVCLFPCIVHIAVKNNKSGGKV